jgi:raffinose/stachyose/melibiose transport system permease protein
VAASRALPVLLYLFMVIIPLAVAVYFSLYNTFMLTPVWVGLDNFKQLLADSVFWLSLKNNVIVILVSIVFQIGLAFLLTAMMAARWIYFSKFVRSVFFFPVVVSPLVIGYIWQIMYSSQYGLINPLLALVGLKGLEQNWLSDPKIIMVSVSIPLAWQFIGLYLVILLSGFTSIDREILEAAEVDGATGFGRTIHIILPLMKTTINVCLLLCISGGIKIFDQIYALTGGGPGYSSSVLAMYAYDVTFQQANYGYGSAISIAMLVISLVVIIVLSKVRGATRHDA